ncbi:FAD/NAD(P)-binding domain-containing protein [Martensiomyces pterosporus]|nr:FAD/NAD(P)-binding domain-containing protein [Martensiomyces pterosporus]
MSTRNIHVVIVGISSAGFSAAKAIAQFAKSGYPNLRITMVDKNSYHYHAIGAPRSLVEKDFGKGLLFPLADLLRPYEADPHNPKHTFIQAGLEAVTSSSTLTLTTGKTLSFDYLVLATGTSSSRPAKFTGSSIDDAEGEIRRLFESVRKAKSVLIVGGGAVGVESAGEIATSYPGKKVTLVHGGDRLLPLNFKPALSDGAVKKLTGVGVNVVLNEKIIIPSDTEFNGEIRPLTLEGESGKLYESDLQIMATGSWLNTEYLAPLESALHMELRAKRGAIKVASTLQLDAVMLPHVFAPGDVNNLPFTAKFAVKASGQGQVVADNIASLITTGYDTSDSRKKLTQAASLKEWKDPYSAILVPIGKEQGVMQLFGMAMTGWGIPNFLSRNLKGKDYFRSKAAKEFASAA